MQVEGADSAEPSWMVSRVIPQNNFHPSKVVPIVAAC